MYLDFFHEAERIAWEGCEMGRIKFISVVALTLGFLASTLPSAYAFEEIWGGEKVEPQDPLAQYLVGTAAVDRKFSCSGVIVAPDVILTAAHCLKRRSVDTPPKWPQKLKFGLSVIEQPLLVIDAHDMLIHPRWDSSGIDLALIHFKHSLPEFFSPIPIAPLSFEPVQGLIQVGYGVTSKTPSDDDEVGVLFKKSAIIISRSQNFLRVSAGPCSGDSGGPLIAQNSHGNPSLIGIVSRVDTEFGDPEPCARDTVYVNVANFQDWIDEGIKILRYKNR